MNRSPKVVIPVAVIGGVAQYIWLDGIPSMSRHALGVAISAVVACVVAVLVWQRIRRHGILASHHFIGGVCVVAGAVGATMSYWILSLSGEPVAASNTLENHPGVALVLTLGLSAGWLVGLVVWLYFCLGGLRDLRRREE